MNENYLKRIFSESFRKGAIRYGFIEKNLPFSADYDTYTSICADNKNDLVKLISPDGKIVCLRMDQTVMAVLNEEQKGIDTGECKRIFYIDEVYTINRSKGILDEIGQYGLEIFQESEVTADCETLAAAVAILGDVGVQKDDIKIEINNVKFPREVVKSSIPAGAESMMDKILHFVEEKNRPALRNLGDGFDATVLVALADAFGDFDEAIAKMRAYKLSDDAQDALDELKSLKELLCLYGLDNIEVDLGATNRYHYYDTFMYRIYSMETGKIIAAGGRYDNLGSSDMKGCGITFYEESLVEVLEMKNRFESYGYELDYSILASDEMVKDVVRLAQGLRALDLKTVTVNIKKDYDNTSIPAFAKKARNILLVGKDGLNVIDQENSKEYGISIDELLKREESVNNG